jgi:hypothetical protein
MGGKHKRVVEVVMELLLGKKYEIVHPNHKYINSTLLSSPRDYLWLFFPLRFPVGCGFNVLSQSREYVTSMTLNGSS